MVQVGDRQNRLRAAKVHEITQTARRLLVQKGPEAVTMHAIAREMSMTAPALYRYFDSRQQLLRHIVATVATSLIEDLQTALHAGPDCDTSFKFVVVARQFRHWALTHKREYALIFDTSLRQHDFVAEYDRLVGHVFLALFEKLWHDTPIPIATDDEIDPLMLEQLARDREWIGPTDLPLGALVVFLNCWIRLQGFVTLEAYGQLRFAVENATPMFELMLAEVTRSLALTSPLSHPNPSHDVDPGIHGTGYTTR
jgi:AcrR family transcriptional regulator